MAPPWPNHNSGQWLAESRFPFAKERQSLGVEAMESMALTLGPVKIGASAKSQEVEGKLEL